MLVADVDHGGGPGHLDAGDAGGELGEVFDVLGAGESDAFGDVEGDPGFEEEGSGEVGSGLEGDGGFLGGCGVDGFLDGCGVGGCAVALRSVVVGQKYFLGGVRGGGDEGEEESDGELWGVSGDGDHAYLPPPGVKCAKSSK